MCLSGLGLAGCGGNESNHPPPPPLSRSSALLLVLVLLRLRSGTGHALRKQITQSGVTLTCLGRADTPHIFSNQPFIAGQMLLAFITARSPALIQNTDSHLYPPCPGQRSYSCSAYSTTHEFLANPFYSVSGLTYRIHIAVFYFYFYKFNLNAY